jgi:hypothetical protein
MAGEENPRQSPPVCAQVALPERVHTEVNAPQPSSGEAVFDHFVTDAGREKLRPSHDVMLPRRKGSDQLIGIPTPQSSPY